MAKPHKAFPRSTWLTERERWPELVVDPILAEGYLAARPWLFRLTTPEFDKWFWSHVDVQPDGCWLWRPGDMRVSLDWGWSESAERIAWCLKERHEPGDWLLLVRDCPNDRCVNPEHLFFAGQLVDFYSRVRRNEAGCWLWQGARTTAGYGRYWAEGREFGAHRYAYEYDYQPIGKGECVCHTCDRPACVNPKHLFVTTHRGNMADMARKGRQARGARHPNAHIGPTLAHLAISWLLTGTPIQEVAASLCLSTSSLRQLLRGEHWTQQEPHVVCGETINLRRLKISGTIEDVRLEPRLDDDRSLLRFRFFPQQRAPAARRGRPFAFECRGVFTGQVQGRLREFARDESVVDVGGFLAPYSGPVRNPPSPGFEFAVIRYWEPHEDGR